VWSLGFVTTYAVLALTWSVSDVLELRELPTPGVLDGLRDTALTALPLLYVAGFTAQRPSRAHVADLLLAARDEHHPGRLRDLVARAIGDPDAVVGWWDSRTRVYLDHRADVVPVRDGDALRVEAAGRPIAVVSSRRLGDVEQGVRDSVAQALLLAAENRRLTAELEASLEQVRDSRARILTASDDTRRRIERDLHDGAQQLLISTGIKLNLAAAQAGRDDPARLTEVIEEAQAELNRALAELRNLATGIAPTSLVHGSLANALRELALRSAVPTTVRVTGEGQPDQHTASTVYFVVAECLANVAKHADASRATVELVLDHPIRLAVSDDGRGGATFDSAGTGLRGLVDRVEALGGRLDVVSGREGTVVGASIPQGVAESAER
jgi:signal transduction histidine kinase